ncbi:MAG: hypothetical protein WBV41_03445, partial [Terriglobales bacterium]
MRASTRTRLPALSSCFLLFLFPGELFADLDGAGFRLDVDVDFDFNADVDDVAFAFNRRFTNKRSPENHVNLGSPYKILH